MDRQPVRKRCRQFLHLRLNCADRLQGISARRKLDSEAGSRLPLKLCIETVRLGAQLDSSHVFQTYVGAVLINPQLDVTELLWRSEKSGCGNGGLHYSVRYRWRAPNLPGSNLHVLIRYRMRNV